MDLTVMSFNLRFWNKKDEYDWPRRLPGVVAAVQASQPAVIGTQECLHEMLLDLLNGLPGYTFIGEGREGGEKGEYSAILYRTDLLKLRYQGQFWLSDHPEIPSSNSWMADWPRICTWGWFQPIGEVGPEFLVYNTHLDNGSQKAREKGVRMIWDVMARRRELSGLPGLLMGDLNAEPHNPVVGFLRGAAELEGEIATLNDLYQLNGGEEAVGPTYHDGPGFCSGDSEEARRPRLIDYIFATTDVTSLSVEVDRRRFGDLDPSDHYPVVGRVRLPD